MKCFVFVCLLNINSNVIESCDKTRTKMKSVNENE